MSDVLEKENATLKQQAERLNVHIHGLNAQIQACKQLLGEGIEASSVTKTNLILSQQSQRDLAQRVPNLETMLQKANAEIESLKKEIEDLKKPVEVPPAPAEPVAPANDVLPDDAC